MQGIELLETFPIHEDFPDEIGSGIMRWEFWQCIIKFAVFEYLSSS